MWNSVSGRLTYKGADVAHVRTGGLEWELYTTARSLEVLPDPGEEVTLYTFLYHRDDQMRLYGFATVAERNLFLDLLRVDGVGPRLVARILSGIDAAELVHALEGNDLVRLVQIPGLGNKTAQKMVLALQGKLTQPPAAASPAPGLEADLLAALTGMGFGRRESRDAVRAVLRDTAAHAGSGAEREQEALRRAVARLSSLTSERTESGSG